MLAVKFALISQRDRQAGVTQSQGVMLCSEPKKHRVIAADRTPISLPLGEVEKILLALPSLCVGTGGHRLVKERQDASRLEPRRQCHSGAIPKELIKGAY